MPFPHKFQSNPTWKDNACTEHDEALAELRESLDRYQRACATIDYGLQCAADLVNDDPVAVTGHQSGTALDLENDPGLLNRAAFYEVTPYAEDSVGELATKLNQLLANLFDDGIDFPSPVRLPAPDNDVVLLLDLLVRGCHSLGGGDCDGESGKVGDLMQDPPAPPVVVQAPAVGQQVTADNAALLPVGTVVEWGRCMATKIAHNLWHSPENWRFIDTDLYVGGSKVVIKSLPATEPVPGPKVGQRVTVDIVFSLPIGTEAEWSSYGETYSAKKVRNNHWQSTCGPAYTDLNMCDGTKTYIKTLPNPV